MTVILGIDTSTAVSVGLARDTRRLVSATVPGNRHVELLVPTADELLRAAGLSWSDVEAVAVGLGPGPFTGLRVGIVAAQVLAATRGLPIRGVCSLDALAVQSGLGGELVVATDARRKELYWARYADGVRVGDPTVSPAAALPDLPVVGPGAALYPETLGGRARLDLTEAVDGAVLAAAASRLPDLGLEPLYLRKPDATEPGPRKSALVGQHESVNR